MPALTQQNELVRSRNVSASEVAALMPGGHMYTSPEAIYDRLTGAGDERRESEAMSLGSHMESAILRFAERRDGFRARLNARTFESRSVRLCATPDAFVIGRHPSAMTPERALVEIKMSGRQDLWREVPSAIAWQVAAQMHCTGRDVVYIYALVGMSLRAFAVYRDLELEAQMTEAVATFWRDHIVARVRPEPADPVPPLIFSFEADRAIPEKEATA